MIDPDRIAAALERTDEQLLTDVLDALFGLPALFDDVDRILAEPRYARSLTSARRREIRATLHNLAVNLQAVLARNKMHHQVDELFDGPQ